MGRAGSATVVQVSPIVAEYCRYLNGETPEWFDVAHYLAASPSVREALGTGECASAFEHYVREGRADGLSVSCLEPPAVIDLAFDPCSTKRPPPAPALATVALVAEVLAETPLFACSGSAMRGEGTSFCRWTTIGAVRVDLSEPGEDPLIVRWEHAGPPDERSRRELVVLPSLSRMLAADVSRLVQDVGRRFRENSDAVTLVAPDAEAAALAQSFLPDCRIEVASAAHPAVVGHPFTADTMARSDDARIARAAAREILRSRMHRFGRGGIAPGEVVSRLSPSELLVSVPSGLGVRSLTIALRNVSADEVVVVDLSDPLDKQNDRSVRLEAESAAVITLPLRPECHEVRVRDTSPGGQSRFEVASCIVQTQPYEAVRAGTNRPPGETDGMPDHRELVAAANTQVMAIRHHQSLLADLKRKLFKISPSYSVVSSDPALEPLVKNANLTYVLPRPMKVINQAKFMGGNKIMLAMMEYLGDRDFTIATTNLGKKGNDVDGALKVIANQARPDIVLVEYGREPRLLRELQRNYPDARIVVRSHNAEGYHRFSKIVAELIVRSHGARTSPLPVLRWVWREVVMLLLYFAADVHLAAKADRILTLSPWERLWYWRLLFAAKKTAVSPCLFPRSLEKARPPQYFDRPMRVVMLTSDTKPGPVNVISALRFSQGVERLRRLRPARTWTFTTTGDVASTGLVLDHTIETTGLVDDVLTVLDSARAMVIPSRVGFGFKTKILDAWLRGCWILVPASYLGDIPEEIRPCCLAVNWLKPREVSAVLEICEFAAPPEPDHRRLRSRAYETLDEALGVPARYRG